MTTAKDEVREILDRLPDDASFEDIQHQIYLHVRQMIEQRLKDAEQGRIRRDEEPE